MYIYVILEHSELQVLNHQRPSFRLVEGPWALRLVCS